MVEYLAEAYRLAAYQTTPYVTTSDLALALGVSAPAVTRMVMRLKEGGYLEHVPYQGVKLTPSGERAALHSIRRHRLVERFLVDVMGFGWHEVHEAADELDAAVSDRLVTRMETMAGYPRRCPHGEPIPTADGHMPRVVDAPLSQADAGEYCLSRVHTHDAEMLSYLNSLGLRPGSRFTLLERAPFHGPLHLRVAGADAPCFIGHELAQALRVCAPDQFELK
jgi:DtxR family transcriptional regulator, Mn-dependent transcriptional regulator